MSNGKITIGVVNQKVEDLKEQVGLLKSNDLYHLDKKMDVLENKINILDKKLYGIGLSATILAPMVYWLLQRYMGV